MTGAAQAVKFDISVVIPALNGEEYLPILLKSIEAQTLLPNEIIVVDSSPSNRTADILEKWEGPIPIVLERLAFAYPGCARNVGVKLAKGEWIAFIDCRTLPSRDWLETSVSVAQQSGAEFVGALCTSDADTHFKQGTLLSIRSHVIRRYQTLSYAIRRSHTSSYVIIRYQTLSVFS